jgi:hypothetical protein
MKKVLSMALVMAFLLSLGAAAQPAKAEAKVTVVGKVAVKTENNVKSVTITVTEAKDAAGAAMASLVGKALKVTGAKVADVEKLADKVVTATGTLADKDTAINVTTVAEKVAEKK